MDEAAKIQTAIIKELTKLVKPGLDIYEIEKKAQMLVAKYKVKPFNKGYEPDWAPGPYPYITCVCINSEIAHGFPVGYQLKNGDTCSIDLSIQTEKGFCADAGLTLAVGEVGNTKKRLMYHTYHIMMDAIKRYFYPKINTEEIAYFIEMEAKRVGYKAIRRFGGHRIGKKMHLKPNIYNTVEPGHKWDRLERGKVYCIEPFLTTGLDDYGVVSGTNGWSYKTADNKPVAFFEHMVRVTQNGPEILTDHIIPPKW